MIPTAKIASGFPYPVSGRGFPTALTKAFFSAFFSLLFFTSCTTVSADLSSTLSSTTLANSAGPNSPIILTAVVVDAGGHQPWQISYEKGEPLEKERYWLRVSVSGLTSIIHAYVAADPTFEATAELQALPGTDNLFEVDLADIPNLENLPGTSDEDRGRVLLHVMVVDRDNAETEAPPIALQMLEENPSP